MQNVECLVQPTSKMDKNIFTIIKGGKAEKSSPNTEKRIHPKCKFCSQPMIEGEQNTYYCTCKNYVSYLSLLEHMQKLEETYKKNMATYQAIGQKLLQESDYYKKVAALTRQRQTKKKEEKQNPVEPVKVVSLTDILDKKNKEKQENEDILGYYWFPPIN